jgi:predicted CXXCH cytochrome family protein
VIAALLAASVFAKDSEQQAQPADRHASGASLTLAQLPVIPPARKGDQCVADTDVMRREHMSLLNHQRDETVIEGIRGKPFSLVDCVDCHAQQDASGNAIRIDAEGQFCESCHTYAAVKIDCFSCHAAKPEPDKIIGYLNSLEPYSHAMASYHSPHSTSATDLNGHEQQLLNR